jgi:hypothetical protein
MKIEIDCPLSYEQLSDTRRRLYEMCRAYGHNRNDPEVITNEDAILNALTVVDLVSLVSFRGWSLTPAGLEALKELQDRDN